MARGFKRRGKGEALRYAARLDDVERATVADLMEQVRELLLPEGEAAGGAGPEESATGDVAFDEIVSGLGGLGSGMVLDAGAASWPDTGPVPETARSFGERDPALERLLPSGNRTDEQAAAEFRRLTEDGLRRRKADLLATAIAALRTPTDAVELDRRSARAMVVALTDVRLVLGERLGLREDEDSDRLHATVRELDLEHPLVYAAAVYDFLSWLQESLVHVLAKGGDL